MAWWRLHCQRVPQRTRFRSGTPPSRGCILTVAGLPLQWIKTSQPKCKGYPSATDAKTMLLFCPTCGNLLLIEESANCLRFSCSTCPYISKIGRIITSRTYPKLKVSTGGQIANRCQAERTNQLNMAPFRKWTESLAGQPPGRTSIPPMPCVLRAITVERISCKSRPVQQTSQWQPSTSAAIRTALTLGETDRSGLGEWVRRQSKWSALEWISISITLFFP